MTPTVFPCYAARDRNLAASLAAFLERSDCVEGVCGAARTGRRLDYHRVAECGEQLLLPLGGF